MNSIKMALSVKRIIAATILFGTVSFNSVAQNIIADTISKRFSSYQEQNLQEKLFVHTDKNFYLAGEILWFKMYAVEAGSNKPLDLSKVAYLEILEGNSAIVQTKVSLSGGSGSGSVYLPVSINPGSYKLRAYTRWMKNFGPEFYFQKNITILNSLKEADFVAQEKPVANYDISFFPEGGNLVSGIKSRVAFRGTDSNGKGFNVSGTIIDQNNKTISTFESLKFGIGSFYLTPGIGTYTAVVKLPDGQILKKALPDVSVTGYVMHAEKIAPQNIKITVTNNTDLIGGVYLFAHTRDERKVWETAQMADGKAEFIINKDKIGDGISSFTVFNQNMQPVCERLFFKRPGQPVSLKFSTDKMGYESRRKVQMDIDLDESKNQADMSVSVFKLDSLHAIEENNISTYLWFTSDLKGIIESPDYYVSTSGQEVDEATDNLMLTHGWRRFKWENVLQNKPLAFEFLPEYAGHIISGTVSNTLTGLPAANVISYLSVPGKRVLLYSSKSDHSGHVNFYTKDIFGSNEVLTHIDSRQDSNIRVTISSPFSSQFSSDDRPAFTPYKTGLYNQLVSNSMNVQMQNIFWANQIKKFISPGIDSSAFYGPVPKTYLLDNYTRFTTMEEVLREYVIESALSVSRKQYALRLMKPELVTFLDNPLILLDGVPVFNTNDIIAYDPLKVKAIDVINKEYFLGPAFFNGIISFRTYNGGSPGLSMSSSTTAVDYDGLQLQREFYSPVYESAAQLSSRLPDFRNLLYWSPDIKADKAGKANLSFYTSDQVGNYAAVLQGITKDGRAINKVLTFEVKNAL